MLRHAGGPGLGFALFDADGKPNAHVRRMLDQGIAVASVDLFLTGVSSILFKQLAIVVMFSLLMSLFVAVTIVPVLCAKLLRLPGLRGLVDRLDEVVVRAQSHSALAVLEVSAGGQHDHLGASGVELAADLARVAPAIRQLLLELIDLFEDDRYAIDRSITSAAGRASRESHRTVARSA